MEKSKNVLPEEVASKYTCTIEPTRVRLPMPYDIEIDLRTISVEQADELVAKGFDMLVLKEPVEETSTKAPSGKRSK